MTTAQPGQEQRMEIVRCKFCGGDGACAELEDDGYAYVICVCTAQGPLRKGEAEAIAAWNTRPTADLGDDGELIARLRRLHPYSTGPAMRMADLPKSEIVSVSAVPPPINPDGPEAADRLELYREALTRFCAIIDRAEREGFTPEIEQELIDARAILSRSAVGD